MNWRALLPQFGPKIEGFVDRVIASEIVGWAYDPSRPDGRVLVVARRAGQVVAETLADLPRRDLMSADKGDGRHGFRLRVPPSLEDGGRHELRIEAQVGRRHVRLQHGDITFHAEPHGRRPNGVNKPESKQPAAGFIERAADGVLTGWAVNPYDPDPPAMLDVFDDEVFLGATVADIVRPKLQQTGAPVGARGFQFELPEDVDAGAIDRLRVRVAGTYLDLRRSKSYPGDSTRREAPSERPGAPTARSRPGPAASPPASRLEARSVVLLACGAGEETARTLQNWADHGGEGTSAALVEANPDRNPGAAIPAGLDFRRFGPRDEAGLRGFLAAADWVVLAAPGETPDASMAAMLPHLARGADVATWDATGGTVGDGSEVALLLGERLRGGFAVRGHVLDAYAGDLTETLSQGRLRPLELWLAADPALRWEALAAPLSAGAPAGAARDEPAAPAPGFRRGGTAGGPAMAPIRTPELISLAIWSGWEAGIPAALAPLLAAAKGRHVEILRPPVPDVAVLEARIRDLARGGPASLNFRQVDAPGGAALCWRRFTEAAVGEVVVLCHGGVVLSDPAALAEAAAWTLEPRVGAVTLEIDAGVAVLAGLRAELGPEAPSAGSAFDSALAGRARLADAGPAVFVVLNRAALAQVGGIDAKAFPDRWADLDLGLRLSAAGRRTLLLGHLRAQGPDDLPGLGPAQPLTPEAAALLYARSGAARADARKAAA